MPESTVPMPDTNVMINEMITKFNTALATNDKSFFLAVLQCSTIKEAKKLVKERFDLKMTDDQFFAILDTWYNNIKLELIEQGKQLEA